MQYTLVTLLGFVGLVHKLSRIHVCPHPGSYIEEEQPLKHLNNVGSESYGSVVTGVSRESLLGDRDYEVLVQGSSVVSGSG